MELKECCITRSGSNFSFDQTLQFWLVSTSLAQEAYRIIFRSNPSCADSLTTTATTAATAATAATATTTATTATTAATTATTAATAATAATTAACCH